MNGKAKIRNWERWQTYRRDRGMPPWIKVYRRLQNNVDWIRLTDAERGQLLAMWLLAADNDGVIPADAEALRVVCRMSEAPNLKLFKEAGFLDFDAKVASRRRQGDAKVTPTRRHVDAPYDITTLQDTSLQDTPDSSAEPPEDGRSAPDPSPIIGTLPLADGTDFAVTEAMAAPWPAAYPGVSIPQEIAKARVWLLANPARRKTRRGVLRFMVGWLSRAQDAPRVAAAQQPVHVRHGVGSHLPPESPPVEISDAERARLADEARAARERMEREAHKQPVAR